MNIRSLLLIGFVSIALHSAESSEVAIDQHIESLRKKIIETQTKLALLKPGAFNVKQLATDEIMPRTTIEQSDIDRVKHSLEQHADDFALWAHKRHIYQNFKTAPSADGKKHSDLAIINALAQRYYQDYKQRIDLDLSPKYTDEQAKQKSFNNALSFLPRMYSPLLAQASVYVHWFIDLTDLLVEKWQPVSKPAQPQTPPQNQSNEHEPVQSTTPKAMQSQMLATDERSFQETLLEVNQKIEIFDNNIKDYLNAASESSDEQGKYKAFMFIRQAFGRVQSIKTPIRNETIKHRTFVQCVQKQGDELSALKFIAEAYYKDFTHRFDETLAQLFTPEEALKASKEVAQSYLPIHGKAMLQLSGNAIESLANYMEKETKTLRETAKKTPANPESKLDENAQWHAMLVETLD